MDNKKFKRMMSSMEVNHQLVDKLSRLPSGIQTIQVKYGGKTCNLRACRLERTGNNKLRMSK